MQVLTTTGYKNIEDCIIGEQLVAYDINGGAPIVNQLEGKQFFSPDMFEDLYSISEQAKDEDGNLLYEQVAVLDEQGNPVLDEDGNQAYQNGDPIMTTPELLKTKEQVFEETYGSLTFYTINNTYKVFANQSIWANLRVVHGSMVQVGDIIYDDQDADVAVTSVSEDVADGWWRLTVSGDHSYIADNLTLHNASRYWSGNVTSSSPNWNYTTGGTNWGSASGTADDSSVPTSADDVIFDGAGTNGNTNSTISATITIKSLDVQTGYTATMTHNAVLTIAGNWTYTGNYTIAGTSGITISAASTITSNGVTWPNDILSNIVSKTITLVGDFTINGTISTSASNTTINKTTTEIITCNGINIGVGNISGTAKIVLTGGTWSQSTGYTVYNSLDINGNVTISGNVYYSTSTLTYISGTVTTAGSTLNIRGNVTLNTNGITWDNLSFVELTNITATLTSNLNISGILKTNASNATINRAGTTEIITCNGINIGVGNISGTAKIVLTGGTWSHSTGYTVNNSLDINGNVTISGNVYYATSTLTYISGTVTTAGSTLNIRGNVTLNTNGISWNNVSFTGSSSQTIQSNLTMTGTFKNDQNANFSGTGTITANGFAINANYNGPLITLTGGTWSGSGQLQSNININGNVTIGGTVNFTSGTITYTSGSVTTTSSTLNIQGNCTLNTNGITWDSLLFAGGTYILTSDLNVNGLVTFYNNSNIINGSAHNVNIYGGLSVTEYALSGSANIVLKGGTWTVANNTNTVSNNLSINGNVTINGNVYYNTGTLTYISGKPNFSKATLNITSGATIISFNKVPIKAVVITAGQTITMNRFFSGTPSQICQVSSTGANYTITFQDNFEKMGRHVSVSGCTLTRPMQLLLINNPKFNTNRNTNVGVRYINQSPNGIARNAPSISDTMTGPAMGLASDPNFIMQG